MLFVTRLFFSLIQVAFVSVLCPHFFSGLTMPDCRQKQTIYMKSGGESTVVLCWLLSFLCQFRQKERHREIDGQLLLMGI